MIGRQLRLASWLRNGRTVLVALDQLIPQRLHPALADPGPVLACLAAGVVDGVVLHAGIATRYANHLAGRCPRLIKLTTNSVLVADRNTRGTIGDVTQGVALGPSGVASNVFVGSPRERQQLRRLGRTVTSSARWGMPVIAFMNPPEHLQFAPDALAHGCRIGAGLGADVITTNFTGDVKTFASGVGPRPIPVLVEASPLPKAREGTLATTCGVIEAGGTGVLFGARVWADADARQLSGMLREIVHRAEQTHLVA